MEVSTLGLHKSSELSRSSTLAGVTASVVGSRTQVHVTSSSLHVNTHGAENGDRNSIAGQRKRGQHEPDGSYSWVVLMASFIANLIADGCLFSFGVLYVELLTYFKQSKAKTAWVGSLFMAIPLVTGPIASAFTNRFGCRKTTIIGSVVASIGFVMSSFTDSIGQLCFTLGIVAGIGLSMVDVAANVIVAYYFEQRRAFATSTAAAGSGIGTFVFAMLTEWLVELYTWKGAVLVIGGIMLNMVVCGALFVPIEMPRFSSSDDHLDTDTSSIDDNVHRQKKNHCRFLRGCHLVRLKNFIKDVVLDDAICRSLGFIYFSMSCFMLYMWYDIPYIYIPDKAIEMRIPDNLASFLVSIIGIVSTVGQIVIGYLGDRPQVDTFYLYSALTATAGIATILVPLTKGYTGMAIYAAAYGLFISANYALTTILLVELVGLDHLTSGYGLLLLFQGIANLIGPPVAGWIYDTTGAYDFTFYVSGAGILMSGLMLFARPWLMRCAPDRYYGSDVNRMRAEAENATEKAAILNRTEPEDSLLDRGSNPESGDALLGKDTELNRIKPVWTRSGDAASTNLKGTNRVIAEHKNGHIPV